MIYAGSKTFRDAFEDSLDVYDMSLLVRLATAQEEIGWTNEL